ncbi:DUF6928 family protein [Nocardia sp. NPDC127579]|uniref:DUF6928 family protein n=1 Tax=Nocardia sp. NPDC127579 TaxID=3345402 RepID=UPI00363B9A08
MGARTSILVHADTDPIPVLRSGPAPDRDAARAAVEQLFPGRAIEVVDDAPLHEIGIPDDDLIYIGCYPEVRVVCGVYIDLPSTLAPHLLDARPGRRVYTHSMYSVTDSLAVGVWENSTLRRSLSLSPDTGIREESGIRLPFEIPYWEGAFGVDADYPLNFHPLELGEEALRAFFGFVLEGSAGPEERLAARLTLCGFRLGPPGSAPAAGATLRARSQNGACVDDPSPDTVIEMLGALTAPYNNFLILERLDTAQTFIQTYRHRGGEFDLEYREGNADTHFHTTAASSNEVSAALIGWSTGRSAWHDLFEWTRLDEL